MRLTDLFNLIVALFPDGVVALICLAALAVVWKALDLAKALAPRSDRGGDR